LNGTKLGDREIHVQIPDESEVKTAKFGNWRCEKMGGEDKDGRGGWSWSWKNSFESFLFQERVKVAEKKKEDVKTIAKALEGIERQISKHGKLGVLKEGDLDTRVSCLIFYHKHISKLKHTQQPNANTTRLAKVKAYLLKVTAPVALACLNDFQEAKNVDKATVTINLLRRTTYYYILYWGEGESQKKIRLAWSVSLCVSLSGPPPPPPPKRMRK
jgi:hypothetical protein